MPHHYQSTSEREKAELCPGLDLRKNVLLDVPHCVNEVLLPNEASEEDVERATASLSAGQNLVEQLSEAASSGDEEMMLDVVVSTL